MQRTVFSTPVISHFFVFISWIAFKFTGWRVEGRPPEEDKFVVIGAPHTSNWDFPLALATAFLLRLDITWLGKDSLFKGPLDPVMRWFGGLPVNRSKSSNVVQFTIDAFRCHDHLIVAIAPEGTRSRVKEWKKGFYHIAYGAGVPICRGYFDYDRRVIGFGPTFNPTGDVEKDMVEIQAFYKNIKDRNIN